MPKVIFTKASLSANLYHYDFSASGFTPLTQFSNEYAFAPSISPDGQYISFTRTGNYNNGPYEIWTMARDGATMWKVASNGGFSAWGNPMPSTSVAAEPNSLVLPSGFVLEQNYPNPFNPETMIKYELPYHAQVQLAIFDLHGRRVATLAAGSKQAGQHLVHWNGLGSDGNRAPNGVYFYRLEATSTNGVTTTLTKKLMLMK
ncbi:MAG: FlgD immunoglobulin-like domain containing protein [bacterium]